MLATYYQLINNRINEQVPEIATVELFSNQYNHTDEERPIITPAVYIEFGKITWHDTGLHTQEGILSLNIHLVVSHLLSVDTIDFASYDIYVLELLQKLHLSLQGLQLIDTNQYAHSTPLTRVNTSYDISSDGLQIWINTYQCTIIDNSTNTDRNLQAYNLQNLTIYGNL